MSQLIAVARFLLAATTISTVDAKNGADFYWRDYNGTVPIDALPAGYGVYTAQVLAKSIVSIIPGTFYPNTGTAVSEASEKKITFASNFKILCSKEPKHFRWEYINVNNLKDDMLRKCVKAGYEASSDLYVGKAFHENEWKIGKVFPPYHPYSGLRVWWNENGSTHVFHDFQILMFG